MSQRKDQIPLGPDIAFIAKEVVPEEQDQPPHSNEDDYTNADADWP
jgi:hypothetical protein